MTSYLVPRFLKNGYTKNCHLEDCPYPNPNTNPNPKPRRICIPVTLKISIKTGLFSFLTFCCIITAIFGIIDHYYIMENKKKSGKNKIKLITIYPKNHENCKNSNPRVQFY